MATPDITWTDVTNVAPDLATGVVVSSQTAFLTFVNGQLNKTELGTKFTLAASYLAAHLATLAKRGSNGGGGVVSAESVGGVSRQFSVAASSDVQLDTTPWGRLYRMIIRQSVNRLGLVS